MYHIYVFRDISKYSLENELQLFCTYIIQKLRHLIFAGKLHKFCIQTKVSFWPLFIMPSLHSFPAKMSTFIALKNIIFQNL